MHALHDSARSFQHTVTSKLVDVAVHSTISSRLSYMDFSEETTAHFNEVARSMLTMGKGAPQRVTGA